MSEKQPHDRIEPGPGEFDGVDPADMLELACRLAVRAGDLVEDLRAEVVAGSPEQETKSSAVDLVTAADRAAESAIVEGIIAQRPEDSVLGEEGAARAGSSGVRWIIDPIDGTTNYVYGIPAYGVSIAVEQHGVIIAGTVYDPAGEVLFAAAKGRGATRNGDPIHCSSREELSTALVATGFGFVADRRRGQAEVLLHLLPKIRDIRRFGSAALDLCSVACGQVDAYYEKGLNHWDFAAGLLIAREAGAVVAGLDQAEPDPRFLVAAAPGVFEALRNQLITLGAGAKP